MRTWDEIFNDSKSAVYGSDGLSINTIDELFAYVFRESKNIHHLNKQLTSVEKLRALKMQIDNLAYNLQVSIAGLRREKKEKERIQQLRLL